MSANENQIVVYQPNETVRLDVRLENETVCLTQAQLCELFGVVKSNISYHLKNIYGTNELDYGATVQKIRTVRLESGRNVARDIEYFNLDAIISVGYRVNSILGVKFRQWATTILKEYLLKGYSVNARLIQLEGTLHRNIIAHDQRIATLEEKVDFFVQTKEDGFGRNPAYQKGGVCCYEYDGADKTREPEIECERNLVYYAVGGQEVK